MHWLRASLIQLDVKTEADQKLQESSLAGLHADLRDAERRATAASRLAPEGLKYLASWVTEDLQHCYQVMECEDRTLLEQWIAEWSDLVEFEVIPVVTSSEAAAAIAPRLR